MRVMCSKAGKTISRKEKLKTIVQHSSHVRPSILSPPLSLSHGRMLHDVGWTSILIIVNLHFVKGGKGGQAK